MIEASNRATSWEESIPAAIIHVPQAKQKYTLVRTASPATFQ
jgi:hypothetical protein